MVVVVVVIGSKRAFITVSKPCFQRRRILFLPAHFFFFNFIFYFFLILPHETNWQSLRPFHVRFHSFQT
jgi:hypothetical protein